MTHSNTHKYMVYKMFSDTEVFKYKVVIVTVERDNGYAFRCIDTDGNRFYTSSESLYNTEDEAREAVIKEIEAKILCASEQCSKYSRILNHQLDLLTEFKYAKICRDGKL